MYSGYKLIIVLLACLFFSEMNARAQHIPALVPYRKADKWGYADSTGKIVIEPQWDYADWFAGEKAVTGFFQKDKNVFTYCLIDHKGNYIIPPSRNWNRLWSGWNTTNLNSFDSEGRYGLIDTNNNLLIPYAYDRPIYPPGNFSTFYKMVAVKEKNGLIDRDNKARIPYAYNMIEEVANSDSAYLAFKALDSKGWQLLDIDGQLIRNEAYDQILPNIYYKFKNVRRGFLVGQSVFINGKDSSKRMDMRYGWVDYPKGIYIKPQYRWMSFLTENLYTADEVLYYSNGKKALPEKYKNFSRIGDTIVCFTQSAVKADSTERIRYALDMHTLKILDSRREKYASHLSGNDRSYPCGTGAYQARLWEEREAGRPVVNIGDSATKHFSGNGNTWYTQYYVGENQIVVNTGNTPGFVGVVDKNGNFYFKPVSSEAAIGAYNRADQLLVFRTNTAARVQYTVKDINGTVIVPPGDKVISYAFRDEKKQLYTISGNYHKSTYSYPDDNDNHIYNRIATPPNARVCDGKLQETEALKNYYFQDFLDPDMKAVPGYTSIIKVADSRGKTGFTDLKGKVLFPEISFKYKYVTPYGQDLFLVSNELNTGKKLVTKANMNLFPGKNIKGVIALQESRHNYTALFQLSSTKDIALLQVLFSEGGIPYETGHVYISKTGTIFGEL